MKLLFIYLNEDNSDSLKSNKYIKEQIFFLKYLKEHYLAKLELSVHDVQVPHKFHEVISSHDQNIQKLKIQLSRFDRLIVLSNGDSKYKEFINQVSENIQTISISLNSDNLIEKSIKYDIKNNPTFLPAYGYVFNVAKMIENTMESTKLNEEIPQSLIYQMEEFSAIEFAFCLLHQTMPVINSVYYRPDYFYNFPDIGKIVQDELIYTKYDNKYESQLIDKYQEVMKKIYMTKDWNRMLSESTYRDEIKRVIK